MMVWPEQLRLFGSHTVHASSVVEQIKPRLEQSSASAQCAPCTPSTQRSSSGAQRNKSSVQTGVVAP